MSNIWDTNLLLNPVKSRSKKKRNTLTSSQKLWVWENMSHICHICHKRIAKQSDVEFDHVRAHASGGVRMKLAHKFCNRLKSNKGLSKIQKTLGIKTKKKKRKATKRKNVIKNNNIFDFKPIKPIKISDLFKS